ncbi:MULTISPECIES: virB8 family protein [Pseudomonas syringae group]|uniref:virB8 family protein n=1 Tax=Pseudomonas syringae group TaxID=136849 RepID=UPI0006B92D9A|nr:MULTISPECIES: type IV secretion system protein [Pseudomonas syringae group]NAP32500.1 TrwG protein [Pseudomonas syringae]
MSNQEKPLSGKAEIAKYLDESKGLERDLLKEKEDSKKMAWRSAYASWAIAFVGVVAGIAGLRQEAPPPVVLTVDRTTGAVESTTVQKVTEISYGEAVDSYFVNRYVLNHESYDYKTIQGMFDSTRLMSTGDAWAEYNAMYSGPTARDATLGNRASISVSVRSIATDSDTGIATVRYTTQKKWTNGQIDAPEYWIATVGYTYVRAMMTTEERRINPLGFVVNTFRPSPEVVRN